MSPEAMSPSPSDPIPQLRRMLELRHEESSSSNRSFLYYTNYTNYTVS